MINSITTKHQPSNPFTNSNNCHIRSLKSNIFKNNIGEKRYKEDKLSSTSKVKNIQKDEDLERTINSTEKKFSKSFSLSDDVKDYKLEKRFIKKPERKRLFYNYTVDTWNLKEEFLHPLVPITKINNSPYKISLAHKIFKKPSLQNYKTDSNLSYKRKFSELLTEEYPLKLRKVSSVKRIYESILNLFDDYQKNHFFKIYDDIQVGFDDRYDQILKHMEFDNDQFTDDDQIKMAKEHSWDTIESTIEKFSFKLLRNKMHFKRSKSANIRLRNKK
jgi:hypothetical protein